MMDDTLIVRIYVPANVDFLFARPSWIEMPARNRLCIVHEETVKKFG